MPTEWFLQEAGTSPGCIVGCTLEISPCDEDYDDGDSDGDDDDNGDDDDIDDSRLYTRDLTLSR